jgi:uncharacterized integral membrane protein (TIGR00698 family)
MAIHDEAMRVAPGLTLAFALAAAAYGLGAATGMPALILALVIGVALNGPLAQASGGGAGRQDRGRGVAPGLDLAARGVLNLGVALLGARITLAQLGSLGPAAIASVLAAVTLTTAFGVLAARALGLGRGIGLLSGGATAICGASAALAIAAVLPRDERTAREAALVVVGVTTLSSLALLAYPALAQALGLDGIRAGLFLGGSIHNVPQAVAAGYAVSTEAGDAATVTKLLRVASLLPVVFVLSAYLSRMSGQGGPVGAGAARRGPRIGLPWFILAFAGLVAVNAVAPFPAALREAANLASTWCLLVAVAAIGLKTAPAAILGIGGRTIGLLLSEAAFLACLTLGLGALLG